MKDEIKQILAQLEIIIAVDDNSELILENKTCRILYDCITNLQNGFKSTVEELCETTEKLEDYKSRCKKISNLILKKVRDTALYGEADLSLETLLNIANGDDNE